MQPQAQPVVDLFAKFEHKRYKMPIVFWMAIIAMIVAVVDLAYRLYHLRNEEMSLREKLFYMEFNVLYVRFWRFKMPFWFWGLLVVVVIVFVPLTLLLMLGELGRIRL